MQVDQLGTKRDEVRWEKECRDSNNPSYKVQTEIAQDTIYKNGKGVKSKAVEDLLSPDSLTPTKVWNITSLDHDIVCDYLRSLECLR